ncbi:MAG TPA: TetR/AcrR family transcriptional regulator [Methylotenera sp.]|nr:TetR/AcrR family transcriptional regulator [Methylotenera sp.]HPH04270.1 TetR/AcrR family transcriptional regulator [Methylotenera sp.]HPM99824.1 TetR/AcrR family transcriptional regulator [Methylotenera sp.]
MARPAEFERETVLREAMDVFWRKGYNTTSIKDIVDATNIQPGSLYWAFGNKQKLFLAAVDCYQQDMQRIINATLKADLPPLTRIEQFFHGLVAHTSNNGSNNGCLLINTMLEAAEDDQEISTVISQTFSQLEAGFAQVLKQAQMQGEISANKNTENLAKLLIVGMFGLRVYSKNNTNQQTANIIIETLMSALK